ncbi:Aste57867_16313 [Aphanomyces stellatus]|uniref:Aste57867_16313 protein n=1 Tax=Aphanomyces stellatus TaxID=120398 RepID=A0A485L8D8_9STRA|nr:hypothetical protein As57867_016256 [Aphanomyces stellatus]VFT93089.1 Aste57867_16313 [Aphanomyces stellatus]
MDSCLFPWVAKPLCFADFDRQWEMAHSAARQARCHQSELANGAVYAEAFQRKVPDWSALVTRYGDALDMAVFATVQTTETGGAWVHSLQSPMVDEADEQNYKTLGVVESFVVTNALGIAFPLPLKRTTSKFQRSAATSLKMYWGLANDLANVVDPNSPLANSTLVLPSGVASNASITHTIVWHHVLTLPLDPVLTLLTSVVGAFGTIDVMRVPPCSTTTAPRNLLATTAALSGNDASVRYFTPQPAACDHQWLWAGDVFSGVNFGDEFTTQPFQYFSADGLCGKYLGDYISVGADALVLALLFSWTSRPSILTNSSTLSTVKAFLERPVRPHDVPINDSVYLTVALTYMTVVLCVVGSLACLYILGSRGYVAGRHMTSFSLVSGHVWIGRPLLVLCGLVAVSFLATSRLDLTATGLVTTFHTPRASPIRRSSRRANGLARPCAP